MARGRMLNRTVCASLKFQQLPDDTARLLATWLISHLDKAGVFYADPTMVRSLIFPRRTDISVEQVASYLRAMADVGLIYLFEAQGETWQCWPGFADNQVGLRADRETTSYPSPPGEQAAADPEEIRNDAGSDPEPIRNDAGKMPAEEKLKEVKVEKNRREDPESGAPERAPDARAPPSTFGEWQQLLRDSSNKIAVVRRMAELLYPGLDPPSYSYVGRVARQVGGAGRLADLLWQHSTRPPTGDLMAYILAVARRRAEPEDRTSREARRRYASEFTVPIGGEDGQVD